MSPRGSGSGAGRCPAPSLPTGYLLHWKGEQSGGVSERKTLAVKVPSLPFLYCDLWVGHVVTILQGSSCHPSGCLQAKEKCLQDSRSIGEKEKSSDKNVYCFHFIDNYHPLISFLVFCCDDNH